MEQPHILSSSLITSWVAVKIQSRASSHGRPSVSLWHAAHVDFKLIILIFQKSQKEAAYECTPHACFCYVNWCSSRIRPKLISFGVKNRQHAVSPAEALVCSAMVLPCFPQAGLYAARVTIACWIGNSWYFYVFLKELLHNSSEMSWRKIAKK